MINANNQIILIDRFIIMQYNKKNKFRSINHLVNLKGSNKMDNRILPHNHCQNIEEVISKMPDEKHFSDASIVFQQLCDSTRLRILWILCHSEECGINIAAIVGMSAPAVAHHLKSLRLSGLISSRRSGKEVYYKLANTEIANLTHQMIDDFFQIACPNKGISGHINCDCNK